MTTPHHTTLRFSLLLPEKQHGLEDSINVDFQQSVELVHLHFDLLCYLLGFIEHPGVAIDHDGVGVTVNYIKTELELSK